MSITDLVPIPPNLNPGVLNAKQTTMLALLGNPRRDYTDECQPITNDRLRALIVTKSAGPFRVTGLAPAVSSLTSIIEVVATRVPAVHAGLGTAGMLCARLVRGSMHAISNHAWGTAVDLRLNGILDRRGDNRVQRGLVEIAPTFNEHGWFWGAGFSTEDAMHFEASDQLIRRWSADGVFGPPNPPPVSILVLGDRGPEVKQLQMRLNEHGAGLEVDGGFGPATRAAVIVFQAERGLVPDGVVGAETARALELR